MRKFVFSFFVFYLFCGSCCDVDGFYFFGYFLEEESRNSAVSRCRCDSPSQTLKDYILSRYICVSNKLMQYGISGPLSKELSMYAVSRRFLEDGPQRGDDISINGMIAGGINRDVVVRMGFMVNKTHESGVSLKVVPTPDGSTSYAFYGSGASVFSTVAIALLFHQYVREFPRVFDPDDIYSWYASVEISNRIATGIADSYDLSLYQGLSDARSRVLRKANSLYGPKGCWLSCVAQTCVREMLYFLP